MPTRKPRESDERRIRPPLFCKTNPCLQSPLSATDSKSQSNPRSLHPPLLGGEAGAQRRVRARGHGGRRPPENVRGRAGGQDKGRKTAPRSPDGRKKPPHFGGPMGAAAQTPQDVGSRACPCLCRHAVTLHPQGVGAGLALLCLATTLFSPVSLSQMWVQSLPWLFRAPPSAAFVPICAPTTQTPRARHNPKLHPNSNAHSIDAIPSCPDLSRTSIPNLRRDDPGTDDGKKRVHTIQSNSNRGRRPCRQQPARRALA